jgi:hypothetical protein
MKRSSDAFARIRECPGLLPNVRARPTLSPISSSLDPTARRLKGRVDPLSARDIGQDSLGKDCFGETRIVFFFFACKGAKTPE